MLLSVVFKADIWFNILSFEDFVEAEVYLGRPKVSL